MTGIGPEFYQATKYAPREKVRPAPPGEKPLKTVELPPPSGAGPKPLADLLASRRSRRKFASETITLEDFSFLLWAADGVAAPDLPPIFRTAPSAGARHPIDTYVVAKRVGGLEPGVYKYGVEGHSLAMIREGDFEEAAAKAAAGQDWIIGSAAVLIWTAVFERTTSKYSDRGYRYVFLDAGHIGQNLYLACESLGLGMTAIAALIDDEVNAIVGADGRGESVVYMAALGRPAPEGKS